MTQIGYGYQKTLSGVAFDDALKKVADELKKEGFGVLTEIDVKSTLKEKLDVDFRRYKILGACNPDLAHQAINGESHIGLLLPCNVVVQENERGEVLVSIADPRSMFALVNNDEIAHLAEDAGARLKRVLEAL
jgi:uncharacterized protein (DUF302 family)